MYNWFKNPITWLAETVLAHIAGAGFFEYGICACTKQII